MRKAREGLQEKHPGTGSFEYHAGTARAGRPVKNAHGLACGWWVQSRSVTRKLGVSKEWVKAAALGCPGVSRRVRVGSRDTREELSAHGLAHVGLRYVG
jgi:hypothetical protein